MFEQFIIIIHPNVQQNAIHKKNIPFHISAHHWPNLLGKLKDETNKLKLIEKLMYWMTTSEPNNLLSLLLAQVPLWLFYDSDYVKINKCSNIKK